MYSSIYSLFIYTIYLIDAIIGLLSLRYDCVYIDPVWLYIHYDIVDFRVGHILFLFFFSFFSFPLHFFLFAYLIIDVSCYLTLIYVIYFLLLFNIYLCILLYIIILSSPSSLHTVIYSTVVFSFTYIFIFILIFIFIFIFIVFILFISSSLYRFPLHISLHYQKHYQR